MVMKASKEHTSGSEGVVVLKNEPFDNTDGHLGRSETSQVDIPRRAGQYTLKEYHLASKVPGTHRVCVCSSGVPFYRSPPWRMAVALPGTLCRPCRYWR